MVCGTPTYVAWRDTSDIVTPVIRANDVQVVFYRNERCDLLYLRRDVTKVLHSQELYKLEKYLYYSYILACRSKSGGSILALLILGENTLDIFLYKICDFDYLNARA